MSLNNFSESFEHEMLRRDESLVALLIVNIEKGEESQGKLSIVEIVAGKHTSKHVSDISVLSRNVHIIS